jgi:hypothetical protein
LGNSKTEAASKSKRYLSIDKDKLDDEQREKSHRFIRFRNIPCGFKEGIKKYTPIFLREGGLTLLITTTGNEEVRFDYVQKYPSWIKKHWSSMKFLLEPLPLP